MSQTDKSTYRSIARFRQPPSGPGLVACSLGFALGTGSLFLLVSLPPLWLPVLATLLSIVFAWRWVLLRPLVCACIGFLWVQIQVSQVLCAPFPERLAGRNLALTGRIAGLPGEFGDARRFLFRVEGAKLGATDIALHGLVRLSWYRDAPALGAGERWRLTARLKPPHGFANPGGFDYERWLFQQGIVATGYVRGSEGNLLLDPGAGPYLLDRWRQGLRERIGDVLGGSAAEGLVRALVVGDRSGLAPDQWEVLSATGTSHLIAISGLHVGIVAGFLFFLFRWISSRSAHLSLAIAAPKAAAAIALAGAVAYSVMAGFAVSTQRALIMLAVVLGAVLFSRTIRLASGIALALIAVLIFDPLAVLSFGFWLSFGAVTALLFALGQRPVARRHWTQWGRAQWAVALGLLPLLLLLFGRASLIAPVVNLVAVPLFSLAFLPGILIASLLSLVAGLDQPLVVLAALLERGFDLLRAASGWSWATMTLSSRPAWVWTAAFAGAFLLLAPRGLPGRWLGLVLLLAVPMERPVAPAEGEARFTLLDVGQGLAAVVRTGRHTLVYDTGPRFPSGFNTGSAVVLPYLRSQGIGRIDTLVVSHADRDHAGGLAGLKGGIPVDRILSGEADRIVSGAALSCVAGTVWRWDGVDFEILHPVDAGLGGNDSSCVLRVSTGGASVLLTGDIGSSAEADLVAAQPERLRSTILVAAHHGSDSSTSNVFLETVAPRYVLYGAGFANRFGFPSLAVRERVAAFGAEQIDTARTGAIAFRLHVDGLEGPRLSRRDERRLWTHRVRETDGPF